MWRLALSLDAVGTAAVLPDLGAGWSTAVEVGRGSWGLMLGFTGWRAQEVDAAPGQVRFGAWAARLGACYAGLTVDRFSVFSCLSSEWVRLTGASTGIASPGAARSWQPAGVGSLGARLRLTQKVQLTAAVRGRANLRPVVGEIGGLGVVYRSARLGGGVSAGVRVVF